jgi:hypothetical protein
MDTLLSYVSFTNSDILLGLSNDPRNLFLNYQHLFCHCYHISQLMRYYRACGSYHNTNNCRQNTTRKTQLKRELIQMLRNGKQFLAPSVLLLVKKWFLYLKLLKEWNKYLQAVKFVTICVLNCLFQFAFHNHMIANH